MRPARDERRGPPARSAKMLAWTSLWPTGPLAGWCNKDVSRPPLATGATWPRRRAQRRSSSTSPRRGFPRERAQGGQSEGTVSGTAGVPRWEGFVLLIPSLPTWQYAGTSRRRHDSAITAARRGVLSSGPTARAASRSRLPARPVSPPNLACSIPSRARRGMSRGAGSSRSSAPTPPGPRP